MVGLLIRLLKQKYPRTDFCSLKCFSQMTQIYAGQMQKIFLVVQQNTDNIRIHM